MARQLGRLRASGQAHFPAVREAVRQTNKNDFIDAEAICEAASRPSMRFVAPKTEQQQVLGTYRRVREALGRDRVKTSNQIHGLLLEFGISLPIGPGVIKRLPCVLAQHRLPARLIVLLEACTHSTSIWSSRSTKSRRRSPCSSRMMTWGPG